MSNTLNILSNKSNLLKRKLRNNGIDVLYRDALHLFAFSIGKKCWDDVVSECKHSDKYISDYRICSERLYAGLKALNLNPSKEIVDLVYEETKWQNKYISPLNLLPVVDEGETAIPRIFLFSPIFLLFNKRSYVRKEEIKISNDEGGFDTILYTGETLNMYDQHVLFSLLYFHPSDCPVGISYQVSLQEVSELRQKPFSDKGFRSSLNRLKNCCLEIPHYAFSGALVEDFKVLNGIKQRQYKITLNPDFINFYRSPGLAQILAMMN